MSESSLTKSEIKQENVFVKTLRLTINLLTNVLLCLCVFVCLMYACMQRTLNFFHWHIILCVLGYQFFINQGILILSRYNSWSMHLNRRYKKNLHIAFQLIGFILIIVGSAVIVCEKSSHFQTIHGSLGICAVFTSIISIANGVSASYAYRLSRSYVLGIKYIHYFTGILTMFLSTACLCTGFEGRSFKFWVSNDDAVTVLVFITWLFTLFVGIDFWFLTGDRLRKLL